MEGETRCSGSRLSDNVNTACICVVTEWKWVSLKKKKFFFRETPTSPWAPFRAKFRPLGRLFRPSRPLAWSLGLALLLGEGACGKCRLAWAFIEAVKALVKSMFVWSLVHKMIQLYILWSFWYFSGLSANSNLSGKSWGSGSSRPEVNSAPESSRPWVNSACPVMILIVSAFSYIWIGCCMQFRTKS